MIRSLLHRLAVCGAALCAIAPAFAKPLEQSGEYAKRAAEVTEYIHEHFWDDRSNRYVIALGSKEPDHLWGGGVMFSALCGAARHDPTFYKPILKKYFDGLEGYWDDKAKVPGYEPSPTAGNGHDKYYDDNAWMVITYLEAYELTKESRYLKKAKDTLDFVLSGWDDQAGGGIWWHERHNDDAKNTCVNGPAAVGCFLMAKYSKHEDAVKLVDKGVQIVEWTTKNLRAPNDLYWDHIKVSTGNINKGQLTYNSGLMLRAYLGMHAWLQSQTYLDSAKTLAHAADGLLDRRTGAYRDPMKWSHLMVEADIELYRTTNEEYLLKRAKTDADVNYAKWQETKPNDLIANASLARELWLLADLETPEGRAFWKEANRPDRK